MGSRPRPFPDLRSFTDALERSGELVHVRAQVDPRLEVSEITQRCVRRGGPALLFERVRGADFPLVTNLFGTMRRVEVNGQPGAILMAGGGVVSVMALDIVDGRIQSIRSIVNPDKLAHVGEVADWAELMKRRS